MQQFMHRRLKIVAVSEQEETAVSQQEDEEEDVCPVCIEPLQKDPK